MMFVAICLNFSGPKGNKTSLISLRESNSYIPDKVLRLSSQDARNPGCYLPKFEAKTLEKYLGHKRHHLGFIWPLERCIYLPRLEYSNRIGEPWILSNCPKETKVGLCVCVLILLCVFILFLI